MYPVEHKQISSGPHQTINPAGNTLFVIRADSNEIKNKFMYISSRFFENQPKETCSGLSEQASKGMFLKPEKLQNHSNGRKGRRKRKSKEKERRRRKKSNGCTLSLSNSYDAKGPLGDNVIKNLARYIYPDWCRDDKNHTLSIGISPYRPYQGVPLRNHAHDSRTLG